MSYTRVRVISPKAPLKLTLHPDPIATDPIRLTVAVEDGDRDITEMAAVDWFVTWKGSYRSYRSKIASGVDVTTALHLGGETITARVLCEGERHRAYLHVSVKGENPSRDLIRQQTAGEDLLRAIMWLESEGWHQLYRDGRPFKNDRSSARGLGQILESVWAGEEHIQHNEYPRITWQWDYAIQASRDILHYCQSRAIANFPSAAPDLIQKWTIAAYGHGTGCFRRKLNLESDDYVQAILKHLTKKPWEPK